MKRMLLLFFVLACAVAQAQNLDSLLRSVYDSDQAVRKDMMRIYMQQPMVADSVIAANTRMQHVDAENQRIVFGMLDNEGWPENLTPEGNKTICVVIDHAGAVNLKRYMPLVEKQAKAGVVSKSMYATMLDRMLMHSGVSQRYGKQTVMKREADGSQVNFVWPVENPDRLDAMRAEVELSSLAEYLVVLEQAGQKTVWDQKLQVKDMPVKFGSEQ